MDISVVSVKELGISVQILTSSDWTRLTFKNSQDFLTALTYWQKITFFGKQLSTSMWFQEIDPLLFSVPTSPTIGRKNNWSYWYFSFPATSPHRLQNPYCRFWFGRHSSEPWLRAASEYLNPDALSVLKRLWYVTLAGQYGFWEQTEEKESS